MSFSRLKSGVTACLFAAAMVVGGAMTPAKAMTVDLGFAVDSSGSINTTNFNTVKTALANAIANIVPTATANVTYRVSVVNFSNTAQTVITRTIGDASDLLAVKNAVLGMSKIGSTTCISCAANQLTANFGGAVLGSQFSLMNIFTDGEPVSDPQPNGATLRGILTAAGWDSISAEAVGNFDLTYLSNLVYPNPGTLIDGSPGHTLADIPNPLTQGFILKLANYDAYAAAVNAKLQKIVNNVVPVPAALPLLLSGFAAVGFLARRRRKISALAA
ncbi:MAG TPA: VWA domain-containing protein [Aestuariivirga sp.]|nr:VWA domain-containing protein [Aestuariivirga sp.]